ncbi:MAG: thioesterase family protein [Proteobacteria bacterium]|nr:thioesterase family protein [Pseudomonadota bacterium]
MAQPSPFFLHSERVRRKWIDYNGHMHEAYYGLVFANATDALYDHIGLGRHYREKHKASIYTLESHINYLAEVGVRVALRVTTQFLDMDEKRMHIFHAMYCGEPSVLIATSEVMVLHVDMADGAHASPFPDDLIRRMADVIAEHKRLPRPEQVGRAMAIRKVKDRPL